jgi:hypothetical protein
MSVHHDQAITIGEALKETLSIPANIREQVDGDAIYALVTAPDDWRSATGEWGTWHWNMAENARGAFTDIRNAWELNDNDNAIARIGVVLHFIGDIMYMPHNEGIRQYYENCISPLGSEAPLWGSSVGGESGKYFTDKEYCHATHYANQQAEAYSDSGSVWYPRKPENYGERDGEKDDGSLDWYLDHYLMGPTTLTSDVETSEYSTVYAIPEYIRQCNPWAENPLGDPHDTPITGVYDKKLDNRWFYWVDTRDVAIAKQDTDNTIRLVYNGVYRALRDGEWGRQGNPGNPPSDWSYWPWPTTEAWLSLSDDLYKEGMDPARWFSGVTTYGSVPNESEQSVPSQPPESPPWPWIALPVILALVMFAYIRLKRREPRSK